MQLRKCLELCILLLPVVCLPLIVAFIGFLPVYAQSENYIYFSSYSGSWSTPSRVTLAEHSSALLFTAQSKVVYDGSHYFVFYFDDGIYKYRASSDGETWGDAVNFWSYYQGKCGGTDVMLNVSDTSQIFVGGFESSPSQIVKFTNGTISGSTITWDANRTTFDSGGIYYVGGALSVNPQPVYHMGIHQYGARHRLMYSYTTKNWQTSYEVSEGDPKTTTGGTDLVPCQRVSPYRVLYVCKRRTDELMWMTAYNGTITADQSMGITLNSGFNSFSLASDLDGGVEGRGHAAYILSNGSLGYQYFDVDDYAWSNQTIVVESGATSPVIAVDGSGNILIVYLRANYVCYRVYDGSWSDEGNLESLMGTCDTCRWDNPSQLSISHDEYHGEIQLVWRAERYVPPAPISVYCNVEMAAALMIGMFVMVFIVHMIYMIDSGNNENFVMILTGYIVSAIIILGVASVLLNM